MQHDWVVNFCIHPHNTGSHSAKYRADWDEPAFIAVSESYQTWFKLNVAQPPEAFSPEQIAFYWNANHEHPPLDKVWSGLIWDLGRNIFDDLLAHRLGNILVVAIMAALLYLMVTE